MCELQILINSVLILPDIFLTFDIIDFSFSFEIVTSPLQWRRSETLILNASPLAPFQTVTNLSMVPPDYFPYTPHYKKFL